MRSYLYPLLLLLSFIFSSAPAGATHWRGGYINYSLDEQNPLKAYFTMTLYTKSSSAADEPSVLIDTGDGYMTYVERFSYSSIGNDVHMNLFKWEHTFPSAGTYTATYVGLNRNVGILNLAAPTDQISYALKTEVIINPLNPNRHGVQIKQTLPIIAYPGTPLRFNLLAYDPDGDSLGYELIAPSYQNKELVITAVPGYTIPEGFGITKFGEIYWEKPKILGEYNHAVRITQYRKGQAVGHTVFDMQFLVHANNTRHGIPEFVIENKDELNFLKDGSLLVKPGEKVKIQLSFLQPVDKNWESELKEKGIEDITLRSINPNVTEFSFTATEALIRRQPYGVNFNYSYREIYIPIFYNVTFTIPILIWKPAPIELALNKPDNLPLTAEGHIISKPGSAVKLLIFAKNGLGHNPELTLESNLRKDAELFSFVTRDSADSQVGELIFKPSPTQVSATPYTITVRNTPMQLRTLPATTETKELTLQVLVSSATPTSAGKPRADKEAQVYPNPVKESITISTQQPGSTFTLYAADGRVVYQAQLASGDNHLARPAKLQPGLYFYTLSSRLSPVSTGKLVLQ